MKRILGLDLGTNSIGWALINQDFDNKEGEILGMGSRIIPMSQDILGEFGRGNSISQTAERTRLRGVRRIKERHLLRRERLHRVLNVLDFLPAHYASQIDFDRRLGKFKYETEPKLAYRPIHNEELNKTKFDFLFKESFNEMLEDFRQSQPQLLINKNGEPALVPYDWTIYYLRKKALINKISKQELAWIILNFNQKRGYYQLRGEEEEDNPNKKVEFHSLKIVDVIADEAQKGKAEIWYSLMLENGWVYRRSSKTPLFDWKDKVRDFIVTTDLNIDGSLKTDKEGNEKRSFRAPGENDWTLVKKKTEQEIDQSQKTVGAYIYDFLLLKPKQKIKGKLVSTIERKFYKDEFKQILTKQIEFHSELKSEDFYNACIRELYRNNEAHQIILGKKDFVHLFLEDIIFYQRPLKSQKSSIGNCSLEFRPMKDKNGKLLKDENGKQMLKPLKAIPKSNPYYQEFRIWQWIYNLSIYRKEDDGDNLTNEFLSSIEDWEGLFTFLNSRKEIEQKPLMKYLLERKGFKGKLLNAEAEKYRWRYVEDKKYPCNETKTLITTRLDRVEGVEDGFLTRELEQQLWHIIYSVTDKIDFEKALKSFAVKNQLDERSFVESFIKFPPFKSEYGAFSEKAIKKLLPLMRIGESWDWEAVDPKTQERIDKILTGEFDVTIKNRVREKAFNLTQESHFQGLQLWLAQYIVYGRHAEAAEIGKWSSVDDLEKYLQDFRQHSLRNPIVEQVITETMRVVKDIWSKYGNGVKDFFSEIHVELGREMKNTADDRKRITNQVTENENTNLRIKALLAEMLHDASVENVRPYSPMQHEILKIYEEGVLNSDIEIEDDILKISKTPQPSSSDLRRYKLWLEQRYCSPYTGQTIPLNKLFTPSYEIEHIIPQSRYFDDSFNNKVICESAINKVKDNQIGMEFIKNHHGEIVDLGLGKTARIFEVEAYEEFVKQHYAKNRSKRFKLLMEEIPEKMIERQLNDTRYISKFITSLLSNIVRSDSNDDGVNSKNIISVNGRITNELKHDWGLNDVWNELVLPRFERMNTLTNSTQFTSWNKKHQKFLPTVPLELSKGFSKKRLDHRHHAMDALVIACATRDHVNLLNNKHANSSKRFDLNRKLRRYERIIYSHPKTGKRIERDVPKEFIKPWGSLTIDAKYALSRIIVSFKQNLRVINKATNKYEKWVLVDGQKTKQKVEQKGVNWAIRKPMHKDTVSGLVRLRKKKRVSLNQALNTIQDIVDKPLRIELERLKSIGLDKKKISKHFREINNEFQEQSITRVEIFYWENDNVASRVSIDNTFDEKKIESITDTGIQKILLKHLDGYKGDLDKKGENTPASLLAFSPEGIEEMNKNILLLNRGKPHQPILKVRTYETKGNKFAVGQKGNKSYKFVEAAKGTNLYFAVYQDENGNRAYETVPLNIVIERQKQGLTSVPERNENDDLLLFYLSPNDLIYLSTPEKKGLSVGINKSFSENILPSEIYRVVSFTGKRLYAIPFSVSKAIVDKVEFTQLNKMESTLDGKSIKENCIKISADRIGFIIR
ncbi:type II CRISPR RNA-guided endonuclease Cas9 [Algoriphagus chordae]|uniref:CRISPR-associated endonuclease Cas9 n=1 Tax=Algoriphagus chordae TaxID=237019 RepID=A0A2W7QN93_9BACT|nr:type II CRISPR RNA-guided endonuclease Cas9 [Algoriphagus chordae]PZX49571.1 CRISPR-associated endonuclease Csn1 [Algoriphagus chordae]